MHIYDSWKIIKEIKEDHVMVNPEGMNWTRQNAYDGMIDICLLDPHNNCWVVETQNQNDTTTVPYQHQYCIRNKRKKDTHAVYMDHGCDLMRALPLSAPVSLFFWTMSWTHSTSFCTHLQKLLLFLLQFIIISNWKYCMQLLMLVLILPVLPKGNIFWFINYFVISFITS